MAAEMQPRDMLMACKDVCSRAEAFAPGIEEIGSPGRPDPSDQAVEVSACRINSDGILHGGNFNTRRHALPTHQLVKTRVPEAPEARHHSASQQAARSRFGVNYERKINVTIASSH